MCLRFFILKYFFVCLTKKLKERKEAKKYKNNKLFSLI